MLSLLIDGNNHVARDWHACGNSSQAAARFAERTELMLKQLKPARVVVCWDVSGASFRKALDEKYKAHRQSSADGLKNAIARTKAACVELGIDLIEVPGFEADDLLATLSAQDVARGWKVILSSSDKDLRQLLKRDRINQMTKWTRNRDQLAFEWFTETDLLARFGVTPAQWLDVQILCGDRGDNIIGCKGFGDKTAIELIRSVGSLDGLFADPWRIVNGTKRAAFVAYRSRSLIVRQLCTLRRDVPLPAAWLNEVCTR